MKFNKVPHSLAILFFIILGVTILTYILPAGQFERVPLNGRMAVIPNSYQTVEKTPISFFEMFKAIPKGFQSAASIIFVVLAGGIMFGAIEQTKAIENAVGTLIKKIGVKNRKIIIIIMTFLFGLLGIVVGYEHNIAMVPIAAVVSIAIGGDVLLAAGVSVAAITIGFGLSPINPYTVGIGQSIAELPLFSGAILRSVLCFLGLSALAIYNVRYLTKLEQQTTKENNQNTDFKLSKPIDEYTISKQNWLVISTFLIGLTIIIVGVFKWKWYITELSAIFIIIAIISGIFSRVNINTFSNTVLESIAKVAPGAFMVGFASTIKVLMEEGNINDTISFHMAELLQTLPTYFSAVAMAYAQTFINFFVPSGSGQALATLPVMIPVGEIVGLTRQTTILAFQIGDGLSNLINPTLGGLIAMLSMCKVSLEKWIRFIFPLVIILYVIASITLIIAVSINYQ